LAILFANPTISRKVISPAMSGSPNQSPKLLDRVRQTCQRRQYSYHTEKAYVRWVTRFVRFHDTTHPRRLDEDDIRAFLNHLASDRNVAASTQNQALSALLFLYEQVLGEDLGGIGPLDRADRPKRLPTVLSREEVQRLFAAFSPGPNRLVAHLLYGSGLRPERSEEVVLGCGCRKRSASGSRSLTSITGASTCGMGRVARTGQRCCRSASTIRSGAT
jgi:site-specific recombinase XerD